MAASPRAARARVETTVEAASEASVAFIFGNINSRKSFDFITRKAFVIAQDFIISVKLQGTFYIFPREWICEAFRVIEKGEQS